jgi:hypothetical protein
MGYSSSVTAIAPMSVFRELGYFEYDESYYNDVPDHVKVVMCIAHAYVNSGSRDLAAICGVAINDFGNHILNLNRPTHPRDVGILEMPESDIGDTPIVDVYANLKFLLEHNALVFFQP